MQTACTQGSQPGMSASPVVQRPWLQLHDVAQSDTARATQAPDQPELQHDASWPQTAETQGSAPHRVDASCWQDTVQEDAPPPAQQSGCWAQT